MTRRALIIAAALLLAAVPGASAYTPAELDHVERLEDQIQSLESRLSAANERAAEKQARIVELSARNRVLASENQRQGWPHVRRLRAQVRRLTIRFQTPEQLWDTTHRVYMNLPYGCQGDGYEYDSSHFYFSGYSSVTFTQESCY